MSSSGLIYAVIVGAWAAYLVPMWLRRQDELNEARPTERFSTAIRLLSGRAGMERRYARDRARSAETGESGIVDPDVITDSVDVRAFAVPPTGGPAPSAREGAGPPDALARSAADGASSRKQAPAGRGPAPGAQAAAARARRSKVLARRRRTTIVLFLAFTLGTIVAAVGGVAFLWAPGVPAVLLSAYIAYLRTQERRRFAFQMDRRRAEAAAQRLRESRRPPHHRTGADVEDEPGEGPGPHSDPGLSALAADRRALVEQTDHAEWLDQQRERRRCPGRGESWDPVPVPLPTYVTAPVAPRATSDVDLGAPDTWSSARSSAAVPEQEAAAAGDGKPGEDRPAAGGRTDARRAASARRSRERGRTPLFDQYEDGDRPRAANE
ncbi:gephyrin-like molybdotransferase receptor GlpR [Streptomyces thermodiastaticus]